MKYILQSALALAVLGSCSKLDEKLGSQLPGLNQTGGTGPSATSVLAGAYDAMRGPYQDQSRMWAAQEHTTDECIGPTRAGDWDDNGVWRVLHTHQWDATHGFLADTYRDLGRVIFSATDLLRLNPTPQQAAEARFLRAMATFSTVDGWDQVPYRENTTNTEEVPKVRKGTAALDYIITELNAIITDLPVGPAKIANKDAARALLMKCYLNKGVFASRQAPTFAQADMNSAITLANQILSSPRSYTLTTDFYANFAPANDVTSSENIWTAENIGGSSSGNVRSRWFCTLHYNQNPSGWNGFTTLSDFYDKFEAVDKRRGSGTYPGVTNVSGLTLGFLVGQQKNQAGVDLRDRTGAPLSFTRAVKAVETGANLEVTGIRVVKYVPDYASGDNSNNDYVYFRLADVLLMKAEALLRGGTDPNGQTALQLVNLVRARAGATPLTAVTLDNLIDERGRELYWEGWRRQDLIRFGKFLTAWQEKSASTQERLLFPIPARSLAANPNLVQNPGY
jgi:starch-binding outer membrane protein, SusD/RagB family